MPGSVSDVTSESKTCGNENWDRKLSLYYSVQVIILEVDVWLQLRGRLQGRIVSASKAIKLFLYSILFVAAAYWGLLGDFLDFWDAFMWLVAFVFIEMNLFQWQAETDEAAGNSL